MYTIGQVSEMFNIPVSTLRYYDKEGLFPNLKRKGNIRYFSDNELEALRLIDCLKRSGLEIKDIKQFFAWITEGSNSYGKRKSYLKKEKQPLKQKFNLLRKLFLFLSSNAGIMRPPLPMEMRMASKTCFRTGFRKKFRSCTTKVTNRSFFAYISLYSYVSPGNLLTKYTIKISTFIIPCPAAVFAVSFSAGARNHPPENKKGISVYGSAAFAAYSQA